jgi:transposase
MTTSNGSRKRWEKIVAEYEESNWSHAEVAARFEVSIWSFRTWLYRLRREGKDAAKKGRALTRVLPVEIVRQELPRLHASEIKLDLESATISFAVGTDVEYLAALAAALRKRC